jgi:hypothetical protein
MRVLWIVASVHIDHIIPIVAGGETTASSLALACVSCSLHKAARLTAQDPETGDDVPIYNPRSQGWYDHFTWQDVRVVGLTPTGRATMAALELNRAIILEIRAEEIVFGRHPPQ